MRYRENNSNSDSSYDIVPVPVQPRRHPRAPTTVQILSDDFDAVTHDYDTAIATEVFPYDGVTEVKTMGHQEAEEEPRFSRVYGEWAERQEVHRRQVVMPADFGRYMEEVTRRLQEVSVDEQGNLMDPTRRARGPTDPRQYQPPREGERGGKVTTWREQVARNDIDLGEFGGSVAGTNDTVRRNRETVDQGTVKSRETEATIRRSQSNVTQSYRSERAYSPVELKSPFAFKPQKMGATIVKREKRTRDPSPTRSERIYTLAEINALTGQSIKHSPPRRNGSAEQALYHNRSSSSSSPPKSQRAMLPMHQTSSPTQSRSRSSSTSSVEGVLASCKPSLLHIAPVLSSLGIRRKEHLRALARLREETRDREMKEEMLKQGVTLLEWAILVDKLQGF